MPLVGGGGFGRVFKGRLETGQVINVNEMVSLNEKFGIDESMVSVFDLNQLVTVKQLDRNGFQGNREFLVEVLIIRISSISSDIALMETRDC